MTDQELLSLNQKGFIPGPGESEPDFLDRVQAARDFYASPPAEFREMERLPLSHWDWVCHHLKEVYDFEPDSLIAYYSNRKLAPWQGAASWIISSKPGPLCAVQLRNGFRKGSYLRLYNRDEILAHEAVHAARCAFEEARSEEFLAYFTSSARWRRTLGPIVKKPWEALLFLGTMVFGAVIGNFLLAGAVLSLGFIRLIRQHIRLRRASQTLLAELVDKRKVRAVLLRLTDSEIDCLSRGEAIKDDQSLRHRAIRLAYFYP